MKLALLAVLVIWSAASFAQSPPNTVAIVSITPVEPGRTNVLITWEGSIPPYKLQVRDEITGPWRDASFHIYSQSFVVVNPQPGAFWRVRTIPDRTPPPSMRGFGARETICSAVRFSWDASACQQDPVCADNNGGSGLQGYRIYRNGALLTEVPYPETAFIDTTVASSTTYSYWASAIDKAGNESPRSGTRIVETPACPGDPTNPPPDLTVTLAWDANPEPDIAGYIVYYGSSSGTYTESLDVGNVTTNTVAELVSGTTYYFVVSAYNMDGLEGEASTELSYAVP